MTHRGRFIGSSFIRTTMMYGFFRNNRNRAFLSIKYYYYICMVAHVNFPTNYSTQSFSPIVKFVHSSNVKYITSMHLSHLFVYKWLMTIDLYKYTGARNCSVPSILRHYPIFISQNWLALDIDVITRTYSKDFYRLQISRKLT